MEEISVIGRNTQGRTLVRMDPGETVVDVARAETSDEEEREAEAADSDPVAQDDQLTDQEDVDSLDDEFDDEEESEEDPPDDEENE